MIHPNVRRFVKAQFRHTAYAAQAKPPKISFAMINLSYSVVDGSGARVLLSTWAVGTSAKQALKHWLSSRPDLDPAAVMHTIVTESRKTSGPRPDPVGERVDVGDPLLASFT